MKVYSTFTLCSFLLFCACNEELEHTNKNGCPIHETVTKTSY